MVEWDDACSNDSWRGYKDVEVHTIPAATIGWLICENEHGIVVASSYTGRFGDVCSTMSLSWGMIQRVTELQTGKRRRKFMPKHTPEERAKNKKKFAKKKATKKNGKKKVGKKPPFGKGKK